VGIINPIPPFTLYNREIRFYSTPDCSKQIKA